MSGPALAQRLAADVDGIVCRSSWPSRSGVYLFHGWPMLHGAIKTTNAEDGWVCSDCGKRQRGRDASKLVYEDAERCVECGAAWMLATFTACPLAASHPARAEPELGQASLFAAAGEVT